MSGPPNLSASLPHVVVLGAGPAGLGAAYLLARQRLARVTVLEQQQAVGGGAGSFEIEGIRVDYGSHRLHIGCEPEVLRDIRTLLGPDLLVRPRHGCIRLRGRSIHFPLRPLDLATRLPLSFTLGVARDSATKLLRKPNPEDGSETFASVLEAGLGRTICRDFYFPFARKLWGLRPDELSAEQARRRVSAGSLSKAVRKILGAVPGVRSNGEGRFLYPRRGYGQISEAYCEHAREAGAEVLMGCRVKRVHAPVGRVQRVVYERDGQNESIDASRIWSTIPLTYLARSLEPAPPAPVREAADGMEYRALILIYLVLEQDRFGEYDAYYFPELDIPISRCSEPLNFTDARGPVGRTILCAELPCGTSDPLWSASDDELGRLVCDSMAQAGRPIRAPVLRAVTRRASHAYPIYRRGFEARFEVLDRYFETVDGLLTFGRQGLFAHDNADQALAMAYAAVDCLGSDGAFDRHRWNRYRETFATAVVQD